MVSHDDGYDNACMASVWTFTFCCDFFTYMHQQKMEPTLKNIKALMKQVNEGEVSFGNQNYVKDQKMAEMIIGFYKTLNEEQKKSEEIREKISMNKLK